MHFQADQPEQPIGGGEVEVFGHELGALPEDSSPTGVIAIARVLYDGNDESCLCFRISDGVAAWEAEAMLVEALEWVRECRDEASAN